MGFVKSIGRIAVLLLAAGNAFSQNYLEFIENKGQWDASVKFKGDMTTGAFVLTSNGYRVLRMNQAEYAAITHAIHFPGTADGSQPVQSLSTSDNGTKATIGKSDGAGGSVLHEHVYEMRFLNANAKPQIVPDKPLDTYSNYFIGNDSSKWAANCKTYRGITYKNVYPNIDVRYYTSNGILKYDFIVNPGGDPSNIAMYFDGADDLKIKDGALHIKTSVDEVTEMAPYTYQIVNDKRVEVPASFELRGSIVRFRLGAAYSKTATLVIDPSIIFSTFTGSSADNWAYTATYDAGGNFYAGGIVLQRGGAFPVSNGAFQTTMQGGTQTGEGAGFDIGIMKFDPTGKNRIYATYIGGNGNEQPHSLVVDPAGELVLAGRTTSTNYPVKGALQKYGPGGGAWDIVVTKLNASGTDLIGSVRIGGSGDDGVNILHKYNTAIRGASSIRRNYGDDARSEVILDGDGNIYFASCTQSNDFPTTSVSQQTVLGGTNTANRAQDAVILKLAPDLSSVLYSVLIGGNDDDAAYVLALNPTNGNILAAGSTASSNFPGDKTGVKYPTYQGNIDGFIVELKSDGTFVRDAFFGTNGIDAIYGIQFDKFGFPYISGTTTGDWPIVNATFSQAGGKQFISKLKPDLSDFVYSTIYGTNATIPNISPTAFLVDRCENVYVSGWGGIVNTGDGYPSSGTRGLTITADAYQKTTDNSDFYFFVLEKNAKSQLYGSYFGQNGGNYQEHVDGGTSRFDVNGVIYQSICANCDGGATFPTTPGVWAENNGSLAIQGCNLAAIKIAFNLAGIASAIQASVNGVPRDTSGCVPLAVDFSDTLAMGKQYMWSFNDGSSDVTTTVPKTSHTFNNVGMYKVRLVTVDSTSCNISDTSYITMRVRNDQASLGFTAAKLQPCTSLGYQFNNTSTAIRPFGSNSFRWDFGDGATQLADTGPVTHTYAAAGTYNVHLVLIDTNYCNQPDSVIKQIRLATTLKAQFETPPAGCVPYTAVFKNTSTGGTDFLWNFGDGSTSTATDPQHLYSSTGTYQVRLIASDTSACNKVDTSAYFTITVAANPSASFTYSPNPTQPNTPVSYLNASINATGYKWIFGDGDTLNVIRPDSTVQHLYNASGTFNTCLVAYNIAGCTDTTCQSVSVIVNSIVDVPSAFTPNGDGINDKVYVRGFGIDQMTWIIYNRWGAIVYRGTDPSEGWDGTYNGRGQPQDVYHYTLNVSFSNKTKTTKKGDITLLR